MIDFQTDVWPHIEELIRKHGGAEFMTRAVRETGMVPLPWLWEKLNEKEQRQWLKALVQFNKSTDTSPEKTN